MKHRLLSLAAILVFLLALGIGLLPKGASADSTYYYTSDTNVAVSGPLPRDSKTVTYSKTSNGEYVAKSEPQSDNSGNTCYPAIQTSDKQYNGDQNASLFSDCGYPGHSDPQGSKTSITIQKTRPVSAGGAVNGAQRQVFDYELCPTLKSVDQDLFSQTCNIDYANQSDQDQAVNTMCTKYPSQLQAQCADYNNKTYNPSNAPSPTDDSNPTCEASGFSLSWILCPIIEGAATATDGIYSNLVQPLLATNPINVSNPSTDPTHTYQIWSNFRIYGDIFLVIALLVIVFGESIGGGLIDAYSAKKILPRLLIAAVLINLSIYIAALAIDITNIVGNGIGALIEEPFKNAQAFKIHISGASGDLGMAALAGGVWGAVAGGGALLEFLLVMVIIPALLTFIGILITVLVRQALIIFLVLVSPVAFALYCLPNTEQYFRKWWDLLVKTLLVYPIIAIVFALANVLSVTINTTATGVTGVFTQILSVFALIIPLFLIPFSFRIAGGAIGQLHDLATNYRKRAHGGIIGGENNPDSWRNRTRNKLSQRQSELGLDGKALGDNFRAVPGSEKWRENRQARRAASRVLKGQEFLENDSVAKALKGNDQYLLAIANPDLAEEMRDNPKNSESDVRSWSQAIASARLGPKTPAIKMAAAVQHAGTGFQYAQGQEGYNQLANTMAGITGAQLTKDGAGNVIGASGPRAGAFADAMDNAQFAEKGAGRWDLAGINRGSGYAPESGLKKASLYEIANGKPESITAMAADTFTGIGPTGPAAEKEAVIYKELEAMLPNSKGATRDEIVKQMGGLETRRVKDYINTPTGNSARGRRTYDPASPTAATWSTEERQRGWRIEDIPETLGDAAQKKARNYERPDPNNL